MLILLKNLELPHFSSKTNGIIPICSFNQSASSNPSCQELFEVLSPQRKHYRK